MAAVVMEVQEVAKVGRAWVGLGCMQGEHSRCLAASSVYKELV